MAEILEEAMLKDLKEAFEENDRTSEGSVTMAGVSTIMRKVGHQLSDSDLRKFLIKLGADPDAKPRIDFNSLCAILVLKMRGADVDDEAEIREAFFVLSRGSNGSHVTHEELKRTMLLLLDEPLTDEDIDEMLRHADHDRDGVVNWDDFRRMMTFEENSDRDMSFVRLLSASSAKSRAASRSTTAATSAAGRQRTGYSKTSS
ncbi:hypothetical protein BOX15_Mlig011422g1 [Macrostomum lignano]|uniref:EF-hand domain-containing protein n=1 Tax=Macrostomum lignano TaxID=282301 RepID=A0A267EJR7_9PLAT|nr:hypothetical protein BOX15_Mlig011422g1 [Macrostomum lignano]